MRQNRQRTAVARDGAIGPAIRSQVGRTGGHGQPTTVAFTELTSMRE